MIYSIDLSKTCEVNSSEERKVTFIYGWVNTTGVCLFVSIIFTAGLYISIIDDIASNIIFFKKERKKERIKKTIFE